MRGSKEKSGNKYNARKVVVDGITFASRKEAARWRELALLQRLGNISGLQRQVTFELIPKQKAGDKTERACKYVADFVYYRGGEAVPVVEDVKGCRKGAAYSVFTIKRKLFLQKYGITITEV